MGLFNIICFLCMAMLGSSIIDNPAFAFMKAWVAACGDKPGNATLSFPQGKTFLLNPMRLEGPCNSSNVRLQILGKLVAPSDLLAWKDFDKTRWLTFSRVDGLIDDGNGAVDGQGFNWWKSCPLLINCVRPTALAFVNCKNLKLNGLTVNNSPRNHLSISSCNTAIISGLNISAAGNSPDTDGINIINSTNIQISNSTIGPGDDCVAVVAGSSQINITGVNCGPDHGISVGSLGMNMEHAEVQDVHVNNCSFNATSNGVRIKTWQVGSGSARNISFSDIILDATNNPIIIDQFYCQFKNCSAQVQASAVKVSDVSFTGIRGTSINDSAITTNCSQSVGWTNIVLDRINITSAFPNRSVLASCINAHESYNDSIPEVECLLK